MTQYTSEAERWQAVKDKDKRAAHAFYYAVKTTGIFCVPGCASRRPKQENVEYFNSTSAATTAGYRACKRCRPDDPVHSGIASDRVVATCRTIEQAEEAPSLEELASSVGLSPSHFQRLFTEHVGISPKQYAGAVRDSRVRKALEDGSPITQAIYDAGYGSASRFYERSGKVLGMPPNVYKKGGKGMMISYGVAQSFLGLIMAAFTENGICSIEFGESETALHEALISRFSEATILPGGPELETALSEVVAFIQSPEKGLDLPLDIQGTAFQQRVWRELQNIPAGETRTYSEVAESLGMPESVRAVASACARNRLAVVIPCHRVLRKGGELAGYYWGLERKKALLENESNE